MWTQSLVEFDGRWDSIPDAGVNPLPIQKPIPIWIGGWAEPVLKRVANLSDGWMPMVKNTQEAQDVLNKIDRYLAQAGRSRDDIGIEARISYGDGNPESWIKSLKDWRAVGVTHVSMNTMNCGFNTAAEHLAAVRKFSSITSKL